LAVDLLLNLPSTFMYTLHHEPRMLTMDDKMTPRILTGDKNATRASRAKPRKLRHAPIARTRPGFEQHAWCTWVDQHTDSLCDEIGDAIGQVAAEECAHERKDTKAAIAEAEARFHAKLAALEQASNDRWAAVDQGIEQWSGRADALGEVIAAERADRLRRSRLPLRRLSGRSRRSSRRWSRRRRIVGSRPISASFRTSRAQPGK
jgi:hypothetical protein